MTSTKSGRAPERYGTVRTHTSSSGLDAHSSRIELTGGFLHDRQTALGQHELGAFVEKGDGYSPADARSSTGDESDPIFELHDRRARSASWTDALLW